MSPLELPRASLVCPIMLQDSQVWEEPLPFYGHCTITTASGEKVRKALTSSCHHPGKFRPTTVTLIQNAILVHAISSQTTSFKLCFLYESWIQQAASSLCSSDEDSHAKLSRSLSLAASDGNCMITARLQSPYNCSCHPYKRTFRWFFPLLPLG